MKNIFKEAIIYTVGTFQKALFLSIGVVLGLSAVNGCSLLAPEEPPAPVAVEVPVKTTAPVVNRNFPLDKESQDRAWFEHSTECNEVATQTNTSAKECLKLKDWEGI